jgi:hypothetical protein
MLCLTFTTKLKSYSILIGLFRKIVASGYAILKLKKYTVGAEKPYQHLSSFQCTGTANPLSMVN